MSRSTEWDNKFMEIADSFAKMSRANKKKVGALIVENGTYNILSYAYNGTPYGYVNVCEDDYGNTKPEVVHAEINALLKLIGRGHIREKSCTMYLTYSPCIECAKVIIQSRIIKTIIYKEKSKHKEAFTLLEASDILLSELKAND